jgi:hypothetical protein
MPAPKIPPPRPYKEQRKKEHDALEARKRALSSGATLPPVCGYTYTPRKPPNGIKYDPAPTVCMLTAGSGTEHQGRGYCNYHEWAAEHEVSKMPLQVQAARNEAVRQTMFMGRPVHTDPHSALLEEIQRSAGIIEWLRDKMQAMAQELDGDTDGAIQASDSLLVQFVPKAGQQPSAWWVLYQEERAHLVRTCVAAIKAGVAERRVAIAEQQGALIVMMFNAFIHDTELGLSPEQIMLAPRLIRKHMAALPRGEEQHPGQRIIEGVATG